MAFKQKCKQYLQVGKKATIHVAGLEYSGEVIEFENMNVADAHVTLQTETGKVVIPITYNMVITIPDEEKETLEADDELDEEQEAPKKKSTKKK